jgi:hypothetical protein
MKTRMILGAMMLASLPILGCSSGIEPAATGDMGEGGAGGAGGAGGQGGGGSCATPTEIIAIGLLSGDLCSPDFPNQPAPIEGSFEAIAGGFRVVTATETVEIPEVEPAIPAGTFVRLSYGCSEGFYGAAGAFVLLENVATLDGAANPTEDGSRLWFYVVAGGEANYSAGPFTAEFEEHCSDGEFPDGFRAALKLELTGEGFTATLEPGEETAFTAPSGPHAGDYLAENVNITYIGYAGGDATSEINFRITRAD